MFSKVRPPCASGMVGFPSEKSLVSSHSERAYILLLNCLTVADLRVSVLSRPTMGKMPLAALMWRVLENLEVQISSGMASRNAFHSSSEMSWVRSLVPVVGILDEGDRRLNARGLGRSLGTVWGCGGLESTYRHVGLPAFQFKMCSVFGWRCARCVFCNGSKKSFLVFSSPSPTPPPRPISYPLPTPASPHRPYIHPLPAPASPSPPLIVLLEAFQKRLETS